MRRMRSVFCLAVATFAALPLVGTPAVAGTVTVQVRDAAGAPVADAVVTAHLQGRPTPAPRAVADLAIEQKLIQFNPYVLVVPVGSTVAFPNRDKVRHHVYSFAAAKKFELKLYGQEQNRSVLFDKPGIVPLGCNIHDAMSGFVAVVDTPYAAKTDAQGTARLTVPDGAATIDVWHPRLRAPGGRVARPAKIGGASTEAFAVALRPAGQGTR
jgi:plastocyanin